MSEGKFALGDVAHLKLLPKVEHVLKDEHLDDEGNRTWYLILAGVLLIGAAGLTFLFQRPRQQAQIAEELKQEVVKIVKKIPPRQKVAPANVSENKQTETQPQPNAKPKSIDRLKRMGALGALGSLSKSKQVGGLNLGAANTSAGPGLGGKEGSGGVQTGLYAKGITSAPLGAGGNIQGAGGYGTKGKGGGQAGYGKMSLVGSTGAATVASGLDRDAIAAVINRNLGQVRFCYEQGLQGDPNLNGRVAVGFTIGGNGAVKSAAVEASSLNSKIIEDCILLRLKSWKFPLPQGGVDVKVSYPFVLRRAGQS